MEELGFFNEREAECFDREDTLSLSDLEKLNVSEDMPEMERTEQLLKTGLDKQKISVLSSLPKILASNQSKSNLMLVLECLKVAWQKCEPETNHNSAVILEIFKGVASLASATVDGKVLSFPVMAFHDEYAQHLEHCKEERKDAVFLLSDEQVIKQLVPLALDLVTETQQKDYAEVASLSIIASLPRIAGALKKTQIIRVAIEKGDVSQTPGSRLICCRLLGAVTALNMLPSQDIEGLYFHKMMALCQDTDAEVRKCMCIQLDALARAVGEQKACLELLPELLELLQDEEEQVKQTAFLALLSLLDFFPSTERAKQIIPEFMSIAESQPDYLLLSLAEQYGNLVTKLFSLGHLNNDSNSLFLQCYAKLCSNNDIEVRQFCAYNFPAVVKAFGHQFVPMLMDDLLAKFCHDPIEKVRVHVAAGIHEVALLLGQQRASRYLKPQLLRLLSDESPVVQGMAIARTPPVMETLFSSSDEDQKVVVLDAVLKAMIQYHSVLPAARNREQLVFIETLDQFPAWCSSLQMYEMVIPILFDFIEDGARPVQVLAVQTLIKCIRRNDVASHRYSLLSKLRSEYGHSRSYWRRMLYLDACVFALGVNSRQYCRLNFLDLAIDLLEDPVPNVRLKAISLVPQWKHVLLQLSDEKMLDRIRQFVDDTAAAVDIDRDVANAMAEARQLMESGGEGDLQSVRRPHDELEDKRKTAEEEQLALMSDHEDSSADSKWSSMLEYTLVVGKDGQVVRRARVKSFDLANKLARTQGKDAPGRAGGSNTNGGMSGSSSGMVGSSSLALGSSKADPNRTKIAPKTPTKPPATLTTLPNCATARPGGGNASVKMPQAIKVMGSSGKNVAASAKTVGSSMRSSTGLPKDVGVVTKIPIIRPSAPAKRENSPSTNTKPGNAVVAMSSSSVGNTGLGSSMGMGMGMGSSSVGMRESTSAGTAMKPKATAPSTAKR